MERQGSIELEAVSYSFFETARCLIAFAFVLLEPPLARPNRYIRREVAVRMIDGRETFQANGGIRVESYLPWLCATRARRSTSGRACDVLRCEAALIRCSPWRPTGGWAAPEEICKSAGPRPHKPGQRASSVALPCPALLAYIRADALASFGKIEARASQRWTTEGRSGGSINCFVPSRSFFWLTERSERQALAAASPLER